MLSIPLRHLALAAALAAGSANIQDASIGTLKLQDGAVTTLKIQNAAIVNALIANLAVGTANIQDLAVVNGKIANLAVTDAKIANVSVGKLTAGEILVAGSTTPAIKVTWTGFPGSFTQMMPAGFEVRENTLGHFSFLEPGRINLQGSSGVQSFVVDPANALLVVTSAIAGSASALPALPVGYLTVQINGSTRRIPFYS